MKISVLASIDQKRELQSKPVGHDIEFSWVDSIEALENETGVYAFFDLGFVNDSTRINHLKRLLPRPVFINSVSDELAATDPGFIRMNGWPTFLQRPIWELAVGSEERRSAANDVFNSIGWTACFVPDTKGMVSARVIAMIINEAYHALGAGISTKAEIDIAMKLGTNYPHGPFEWSEKIGLKNIYEILFELGKADRRYEIADALKSEWALAR
jgi:3-hydroxybutyryl-CoA dehydrogenase